MNMIQAFVETAVQIEVPAWAANLRTNEIKAMAAQAYPEMYFRGLGSSIAWHELIRYAEERDRAKAAQ